MLLKHFKTLLFIVLISVLTACTSSTTTVVVTSDATFSSLVLVNSKIANLSSSVFTLIPGDTIVNLDSLPFGTKADRLIPTFSFKSTSKTLFYKTETDYIVYSGKDSIDFTPRIDSITGKTKTWKVINYASDNTTMKPYVLKVNVHKVKPELYNWAKIDSTHLYVQSAVSQKAILLNNKIYYFLNDGSNTYCQTSVDGKIWDAKVAANGLPAVVRLENMTEFNGKLYLALNENKIYSTADGQKWIAEYESPKYLYTSILFTLNGNLNLIAQSVVDSKYHLGIIKTSDLSNVLVYGDTLLANFPISDFTALSYTNRTGISKGIVLGGKDSKSIVINSNWNTENGVLWVNFGRDSRSLNDYPLLGSSLISYDNKLLLFGTGVNTTTKKTANYLVSKDEGFTWNLPDSTYNYLPKDTLNTGYVSRSYQSVMVQNPMSFKGLNNDKKDGYNNIFIIGGKTGTTYKAEVWKGKLNRLNFNRQ